MRLLVDENIPQGREVFTPHGDVTTFHGRKLRRKDVRDADALIVRSITRVDADLLEGSNVRFVGTATIGVDHVDQEYLRTRNIGFSAAPGCNARSVAEYFVAALLHLHVKHGLELKGRTVGVVGYGNVGKQVAAIAPALGLNVLLCDPPLADAGFIPPAGEFLTLHELSARADIVTLHAPLTHSGPHPTHGMVNTAVFTSWNAPKVLMNMGRGEVIDEHALLQALDAGIVRHLVLDVFSGEPNVSPELVRRADLATPHVSGYSIQGKLNGTAQVLEAFRRYFGLEAKSAVTFPVPGNPVIDLRKESGATERGLSPRSSVDERRGVEAVLHDCVRRSYPIERDDAELRAVLGDPKFSTCFDALRKNYPTRHEFAGFRVAGIPAEKKILMEKIIRLGFSLK